MPARPSSGDGLWLASMLAHWQTSSNKAKFTRGLVAAGLCVLAISCGPAQPGASWPPLAKKWFERAQASFHVGDMDDAQLASDNALRVDAKRPEIRLLAARIALAQLEFDRAVQLTEGMTSSDAEATRGRALWYGGHVSEAADVLSKLVADPEVRDPWAADIAKIALRGAGRHPFTMSGGLLAVSEMPDTGRALLVPVELDGEPALAMIATGVPETVVDASAGAEPRWISLRFGERVEVKDIPALTKDLSGYSHQLNAPIKVLLGVNLLRHLRPTIDLLGGQFVVRTFDPPAPPGASTVKVSYARGGGMLLRAAFGSGDTGTAVSLLVDTTMDFPLALDKGGWKKAGQSLASLKPLPGNRGLSHGLVPLLSIGTFEIPQVPALAGVPVDQIEKPIGMDLDGIIGSGLLAPFRMTLVDGGRTLWLEPTVTSAQAAAATGSESEQLELSPPTEGSSFEGAAGDGGPTVPESPAPKKKLTPGTPRSPSGNPRPQ